VKLIIRLLINAAALWVAVEILSGLTIDGGFFQYLFVAVVFGIVNALVRPIAKLLTLPLRVATLGLFTIVVNALMLMITAGLIDDMSLDGGFFGKLWTAILASIVIGIVSTVLSVFVNDDDD
jgi:putative membrane protein